MKCQVYSCTNIAIVRCENGYRYCEYHKVHTHTDLAGKPKKAIIKAINKFGEYSRIYKPKCEHTVTTTDGNCAICGVMLIGW